MELEATAVPRPEVVSEVDPNSPLYALIRDAYRHPIAYSEALDSFAISGIPKPATDNLKLLPRSSKPSDRLEWLFASGQDRDLTFDPETETAFDTYPEAQIILNSLKTRMEVYKRHNQGHKSRSGEDQESLELSQSLRVKRVSLYVHRVIAWQSRRTESLQTAV